VNGLEQELTRMISKWQRDLWHTGKRFDQGVMKDIVACCPLRRHFVIVCGILAFLGGKRLFGS
jgi:hypothetical protein